jgi:hypothetical protein
LRAATNTRPPGYGERPRDTGWYAEFGALGYARGDAVAYGTDASRFAGATFDPSGLYRLNAVMNWLDAQALSVAGMHEYCLGLQRTFLDALGATRLKPVNLVIADERRRGRFLTFRTSDAARLDDELIAATGSASASASIRTKPTWPAWSMRSKRSADLAKRGAVVDIVEHAAQYRNAPKPRHRILHRMRARPSYAVKRTRWYP